MTCPTRRAKRQDYWSSPRSSVRVQNNQPYGFSRNTVSRVMTACTKLGKISSVKQNSGQNSKLTDRDRQALMRIAARKRNTTLLQIIFEMNISMEDACCENYLQSNHPKTVSEPQNAISDENGAETTKTGDNSNGNR